MIVLITDDNGTVIDSVDVEGAENVREALELALDNVQHRI